MFWLQDGTLQVPQSDCTLDGVPLKPEDDPDDMLDFPVLTTPWSENETQLLHQLFPRADSLCLNLEEQESSNGTMLTPQSFGAHRSGPNG